jgi:hypothetical protein
MNAVNVVLFYLIRCVNVLNICVTPAKLHVCVSVCSLVPLCVFVLHIVVLYP